MDDTLVALGDCYLSRAADMREVLKIPRSALLKAVPLGNGEHNANFTFEHPDTGEKLVLRINFSSQMNLEDQVGYEFSALCELERSSRTPRPLFCDPSKSVIDHGVLVIEFREGDHLDFEDPVALGEAARIMADVHAVRPSSNCPLQRPEDSLVDLYREDLRMFEAYLNGPCAEAALSSRIERMVELVESAVSSSHPSTVDSGHVLNTECVPSHFLVPAEGSRRRGSMVDWEKPIVGEVARDVAYFLAPTTTIWDTDFMFDSAGRESFVRSYWRAVDGRFARGSFDERFDAFLKANCLRGITWSAMTKAEYASSDRPLQNEKTRRMLDVYLSDGYLSMLERDVFGTR